jgi:hypothetical protein
MDRSMADEAAKPVETAPTAPVAAVEPAPAVVKTETAAAPAETTPAPAAPKAEPVAAPVSAAPKNTPVKTAPKPPVAKPVPTSTETAVPAPAVAKTTAKPAPVARKATPAKAPAPAREVKPAPARAAKKVAVRAVGKAAPKAPATPKSKPAPAPAAVSTFTAPKPTASGTATKAPASTKEKTMAKTAPTDFLASFQSYFADFQAKAKEAYEKSTGSLAEVNDFAKGNVEAMVESGKILASGLQELSTSFVTESRSAFETMTAEVKELAAAKTPTEFLSMQSTLARKQFDAAVATASKSTEAMLKLANEVVTPISGRVSLAVEKVSKAA